MSLWYHGDMSDDVTPASWRFSLRGTQEHKAIVQRVVDAHAKMGLAISLNDALLVIIRRAATPDADTEEEARVRIEQHWAECTHGCYNGRDTSCIKCPEGWRLRDAYSRVAHLREPLPRPSPTPPAWRRYLRLETEAV